MATTNGKRVDLETDNIRSHVFDNGLVLVGEAMDWLESAAFALLLPAGAARDPAERAGLSNFTGEMLQRGCGSLSSREFIDALDNLGVDHSCSTSVAHTSFSAAMMAENVPSALSIYADLVRRPHLPQDQLEDARRTCIQELRSVEDELAQKTLLELRRLRYASPWGRSPYGRLDDLTAATIEDVRQHYARCYHPGEAILAVAGKFDWQRLVGQVGELFGDWETAPEAALAETASRQRSSHIACDSSQTHIGIAYPSVPCNHPDFFNARGAVGVLSDGMSSRLFTEVRENRGLCYAIFASYHSLRDRGSVLCYAGTSTDRAQETLDVTLLQLSRLSEGIHSDELDRVKARVKSALILQQESSLSRSSSLAADWYLFGRPRSLDEISRIVDGLTCGGINRYLTDHPPSDFVIVTLGDKPLEVPVEVSAPETG
jgi:predicted Zn-dependent peptidase